MSERSTALHLARTRLAAPAWLPKLLLTALAAALLVSRQPAWLTHPDFWAEDGSVFYQQAYNQGSLGVLLTPYSGYLLMLPRLVSLVAVHLPVTAGPLVFAGAALVIDVLPAVFLLSDRLADVVPPLPLRAGLGLLTLALPETFEVNGNLSNAQWHLALLAFLVLVAARPRGRGELGWRAFDLTAVAMAVLTGPLAILLLPLALWRWWARRSTWTLLLAGVLAAGTLLQILSLTSSSRPNAPLNASPELFARILAGRVFLSPILGSAGYSKLLEVTGSAPSALWFVPAAIGVSTAAYVAWKGGQELRMLLLFAALGLGSSLVSPLVSSPKGRWYALAAPDQGMRYFYLPMLAWLCVLVWLVFGQHLRLLRIAAAIVLVTAAVVGMRLDWRYPVLPRSGFAASAQQFERLPPGAVRDLPIQPRGWKITLAKRR